MNIKLNGEPRELDDGTTVGQLLDTLVQDRRGIAVAVDGEVVRRATWDTTDMYDGARVEILSAVQGG